MPDPKEPKPECPICKYPLEVFSKWGNQTVWFCGCCATEIHQAAEGIMQRPKEMGTRR